MKFCFSTLGCTERSLEEVLSLAKKYSIDALELRGVDGVMDNRKIAALASEKRDETLAKFAEYGVKPLVLGTSCKFHDAEKLDESLEEGYRSIDIAESLGFRAIRVFGNNIKGDENECLDRIAGGISLLCEYAVGKGVDVLLETHGDVNTAERLGAVAKICGKYENFGLIWDICHTRLTYGENWCTFCDDFFELIRHVHLKDVTPEGLKLPGEGDLPIAKMVKYLANKGYEGYFSLEWEKKWHPELPQIEEALDSLFGLFYIKRKDIRVRDPFIVLEDGIYYLYATTGARTYSYYYSRDLENWLEGGVAFEIPEDFWAYRDVWAGEVHKYKGKFYLFVSLLGKNGLRGTQIAVSDSPRGKFIPLVPRAVTPLEQSCIDGTLYVHEGKPYIFYSHDWPDNYVEEKSAYVGELWAAELTEDLTAIKGEPWLIFGSDESPISKKTPHHITNDGKKTMRYGSDAPWLQPLSNGSLLLTWSPYLQNNYVVLPVISKSGSIRGPWEHLPEPLFDQNGGHAMFFRDLGGRNIMCIHAPEKNLLERACLYEVEEENGELRILREIY